MYTVSGALCKQYDYIAIGDYAPHGNGSNRKMRRAMNNRSVIGKFKDTLAWTTFKSAKFFHEYDEKGTTRSCSKCPYVHVEGLHPSIRKWQCPCCQTMHIRDENAATNGLRKALRDLQQKTEVPTSLVSCSDLSPVQERWTWSVSPSGIHKVLRGL